MPAEQYVMRRPAGWTAAALFVLAVVAANWTTARFGLVALPGGLQVAAGTFAAGLTFLIRDAVHETAGRRVVVALIATGAAVSAVLAGPQLAIASGLAFLVSETADMLVYQPLRRRTLVGAVLLSNTVGALVDSALFLWLAPFALWPALPGQVLVKVAVTAVPVVLALGVRYAVLRNTVRAEGA